MKHQPPRSLKSRALQLLAQREQSRVELRRKLLVHAVDAVDVGGVGDIGDVGGVGGAVDADKGAATDAAARVDAVLDWLDAHRFLSDERFAESRINARAARYGDLRIRQELKQHGVALDADAARRLRESEGARAWAVWERRFGAAPKTRAEQAGQSRFLSARGFSPDAVRQVLSRARGLGTASEQEVPADD